MARVIPLNTNDAELIGFALKRARMMEAGTIPFKGAMDVLGGRIVFKQAGDEVKAIVTKGLTATDAIGRLVSPESKDLTKLGQATLQPASYFLVSSDVGNTGALSAGVSFAYGGLKFIGVSVGVPVYRQDGVETGETFGGLPVENVSFSSVGQDTITWGVIGSGNEGLDVPIDNTEYIAHTAVNSGDDIFISATDNISRSAFYTSTGNSILPALVRDAVSSGASRLASYEVIGSVTVGPFTYAITRNVSETLVTIQHSVGLELLKGSNRISVPLFSTTYNSTFRETHVHNSYTGVDTPATVNTKSGEQVFECAVFTNSTGAVIVSMGTTLSDGSSRGRVFVYSEGEMNDLSAILPLDAPAGGFFHGNWSSSGGIGLVSFQSGTYLIDRVGGVFTVSKVSPDPSTAYGFFAGTAFFYNAGGSVWALDVTTGEKTANAIAGWTAVYFAHRNGKTYIVGEEKLIEISPARLSSGISPVVQPVLPSDKLYKFK